MLNVFKDYQCFSLVSEKFKCITCSLQYVICFYKTNETIFLNEFYSSEIPHITETMGQFPFLLHQGNTPIHRNNVRHHSRAIQMQSFWTHLEHIPSIAYICNLTHCMRMHFGMILCQACGLNGYGSRVKIFDLVFYTYMYFKRYIKDVLACSILINFVQRIPSYIHNHKFHPN